MFPEAEPRETLRFEGTNLHKFSTNLPRFQGVRPDQVRVESSSCCFPRELVSFDPGT